MGLNRRLRRHALLERHGTYYAVAPAGTVGGARGHPFRWKWSADAWAKVRSRLSKETWRVYRFER